MTVRINPGYAKRIFDELPGRTRPQKAASLSQLFALLRDERDAFVTPVRRPRTMAELAPSITGKTLKDLVNLTAFTGGLSIPVTTLMKAYLMPESVLHDVARSTFDAAGLTVVAEPPKGRGRPITRLVAKAQAGLTKAVTSREKLEADTKNAATAGVRSPWFTTKTDMVKLFGGKGGDA